MNRNPEIKNETYAYIAATLILVVAALFVNWESIPFILLTGIILTFLHYYFSKKRYSRISELSESLNRILLGQESMLISECEEGELSILYSEIHKMTMRLKEQTDLLTQDKKMLTTAIEDIFHQLRTPLTAMSLTVSLLSDENLSYEKRIRMVHDLKRQIEKIIWLVESLLKMSKIDSETAVFEKEETSVKELVEKASAPFLVQMDLKDITFKKEIGSEVFQGDLLWSVEAIGNLLKNAVEHTALSGTISVKAEETALYTEICIQDDGEGFVPEDIPYLFDRFYKGQNASEASIGIGLALSRAIIIAQNGTITARNRVEGGAEFVIKFYKSTI